VYSVNDGLLSFGVCGVTVPLVSTASTMIDEFCEREELISALCT
jgi:hypothetical protein